MSSSPIAVLLPHGATMSTPSVAVAAGEQPGLLAVLAAVADPRDPRGIRYPLASMLAVAVRGTGRRGHIRRDRGLGKGSGLSSMGQAGVHRPGSGGEHGLAAAGPRRCRSVVDGAGGLAARTGHAAGGR